MTSRGTVCLMYHEIELPGRDLCDSDPGYVKYAISISNFREHMEFLKNSGMVGINVSQMLSNPENGVTLTFDDGCETDLITAAPILKDYGFQATFYITIGFLGKRGFLSRQQARELAATGLEIGCHSKTHAFLTDLHASALRGEIADAKKELEDIVGCPVHHFSCPGGRWDTRVVDIAKEAGYASVATSEVGLNFPDTDHFALRRVALTRGITPLEFQSLCRGTGLWSQALKNRGLGLAKRIMGNGVYSRVRAVLLRSP